LDVVVWGTGQEFRELYSLLKLHEEIGDYRIVGYIAKEPQRNMLDHVQIYKPEEFFAEKIQYDFVLVASNLYLCG